ncbi:MAG: hypothetical protein QOH02_129, partial [Gaiellaceae bacterium]|nr:hypothetical protein [Gaiellaceae bacterium]
RVVVVVAEHGDDGNGEAPAGVGNDLGLVHLAVLSQVAGQQDEVRTLGHRGKRLGGLGASPLGSVDVAGGGDPDRHLDIVPRLTTPRPG